jgi:predicted PurR-regulated permease PerM
MKESKAPAVSAEALAKQAEAAAQLRAGRHMWVHSAALAVLATGALFAMMYLARAVLTVVLFSVLLAFILAPVAEFCERFLHFPRALSSLAAVLVLLGTLYGATWACYSQAEDFADQLPQYTEKLREMALNFRQHAERFQKSTETMLPPSNNDRNTVRVTPASDWGRMLKEGAISASEAMVMVSFMPFLIYFMLCWREHIRAHTVMLFKLEDRQTAYTTIGLISAMIRSFIAGNLLIGVVTSLLSAVVFGFIGVPYFYVIALLSGFLSLIPYLGVILAILPPVAASLGNLSGTHVAIIVVTVLALHLISLNVLYPWIIGSRLQLNPLAVTLSLLFWGWLWGAAGLILAVPMTAALKIVFDHVQPLKAAGAWLGE